MLILPYLVKSIPLDRFLLSGLAWNLFCAYALAVQIELGDGTGNIEAPRQNDPGFENVGIRGGPSGVYTGKGWVLTAGHVPGGNLRLGSIVYDWLPETDTILRNPPGQGLSTFADLRMFRLASEPPLPKMTISQTPPELGMFVMMAGNGQDRAPTRTGWNVSGEGDTPIWTETAPPGSPGEENGYKYLSTNALRWGTNFVDADSSSGNVTFPFHAGTTDTMSFSTVFDDLPNSTEAQGATNDSGGAVFLWRDGHWELAGIMHSIDTAMGQPDGTSVFGNRTYSTALYAYAQAIEDRQIEFLVDLNSDATIDAADAGLMVANWGRSGEGDFNEDGIVDAADAGEMFDHWTGNRGGVPEPAALSPGYLALGSLLLFAQGRLPKRRVGS